PRGEGTTCRIATVAVETDWEFNDRLFNGNSSAAAAYLVSLMGAISEIYERDVDVRLAVPFLRVWADNSDPYSVAARDPLDQVRNYWNALMDDVDRTITHYFTGRQDTSYGGVAYVGVLCFNEYGYGVSAYLDGSFPYPLIDYSYGNWDVVVASHEIGHNFGTGHTHSYSPPIDGCGNGDCSNPFGGTIMSYCHTCAGGLGNIQLNFHERVQDFIMAYLDDVNCDLISQGVTAANDMVFALENIQMEIDAMGNDNAQSCDPFAIQTYDSTTAEGGTIELLAGQGPHGLGLFSYTPPMNYSGPDEFSYAIVSDQGVHDAIVSIDVRQLRPADNRINPISGLRLTYYQLEAPEVLPDFDTLDPIGEEVSDSITYTSTNGQFINSGLSDWVGAVFEGFVWALVDGEYTFYTESDDGSALYIGEELVVDNDGLHGMVKRSGNIPLHAGWHKVRIEFFENEGGAGLFASMSGPEMAEQNLTGILLSHETTIPCSPADLNADQDINFFDVSQFLMLFNDGDLAADFDGDGRLSFFDLSAFLQEFNAGCP
ncbi:MAG: M12 family metallo-peptidase, partial [Phycisphaerales bacterium]